jgi:hypothetical protein
VLVLDGGSESPEELARRVVSKVLRADSWLG